MLNHQICEAELSQGRTRGLILDKLLREEPEAREEKLPFQQRSMGLRW